MESTSQLIPDGRTTGVCRCCLSHGPVTSMLQMMCLSNRAGTYVEVLMSCYNLDIVKWDKELKVDTKQVICERCISSLTDAYTFRLQVESSIEAFRQQHNFVNVKSEVKVEFVPEDEDSDSNEDSAVAFPVKTIVESQENDPLKQSTKSIIKNEHSKRTNNIPKDVCQIDDTTKNCSSYVSKTESCGEHSKKKIKVSPGDIETEDDSETPKLMERKERILDIRAIMDNIKKKKKELLNKRSRQDCEELDALKRDCMDYYFFKYFKSKYKCAICNESFTESDDFRSHAREHDNESVERLFRYKSIWDLKLDVTSMKCRHCGERVTDIDAFRNHLSVAHNVESKDVFNRIMPYNLDKNEVKCIFCKEIFMNMVNLNIHIKEHCDSNMCAHCSSFFPNLGRLKEHIKNNHSQTTFRCMQCEQTFESTTKRDYHTRIEHGKKRWNICQYCSERFKTHYQKILHLSKVHNKELKRYQCKICPEKFVTAGILSIHVRGVHLQERNNVCSVCGKSFFRGSALTKHMIKHTGEKNYRCEVCNKTYARPYTLKEHMKIHTNERNHVCQFCGRAFVAKCSLKYHLNVHKNEMLPEQNSAEYSNEEILE